MKYICFVPVFIVFGIPVSKSNAAISNVVMKCNTITRSRDSIMQKKITISDIAEHLGVSRASVSRALNGSSGVGTELREKIRAYAEESGYKPDIPMRDMAEEKMKIVGLVFGDVRNPFYAELTFYIQKKLNLHGYMVMLFNSEYHLDKEMQFIEIAEQYHLAGLMLITMQTKIDGVRFQAGNTPVVFVNRTLELANYDSVTTDNFKAGYIAAMHLIKLGHIRIGFVGGHSESSASILRMEGFKQAMRNCFLTIEPEDLMQGDLKMPSGYEIAKQFFSRESRPSAMIFANDMMALGFLDWCGEADIAIPEEVSIVSFDNIDFSKMHGIGLTTISQHVREMGERAAELMVRRIETPDTEYKRIILEPTLMIRNTTGPYKPHNESPKTD